LKQIQAEIIEKAPKIQSQRYQYNRMLQSHKQLSQRLADAVRAFEEGEEQKVELKQELEATTYENRSLKTEANSLGKQVLSLLKATAGSDPSALVRASQASVEYNTTRDVISSELVNVTSVEDMLEQNRRQLVIIHQVTEQNESMLEQRNQLRSDHDAIQAKNSELTRTLEALREERARQASRLDAMQESLAMSQSVHGSRYQASLGGDEEEEQEGMEDNDGASMSSIGKRRPVMDDNATRSLVVENAELQAKTREQEKLVADMTERDAVYRCEQTDSRNELRRSLDEAQSSASAARAKLAKTEAELKYQQETHELLKERFAGLQTEIEQLRSKNKLFSTSLGEHQKRLQEAMDELIGKRDEIKKLSVDVASARSERDLCKRSEERLLSDNSALTSQLARQDKLLGGLNSIQEALKTQESSDRKRLIQEKEELRVECKQLKYEMEVERREKRQTYVSSEEKLEQARVALAESDKKFYMAREELVTTKSNAEYGAERLGTVQKELDSAKQQVEALLRMRPADALAVDLSGPRFSALGADRQAQVDLSKALEENTSLRESLMHHEEGTKQLKAALDESEAALATLTKSSKEYTIKMEADVVEANSTKERLTKRVEEVRMAALQSEKENAQLCEDLEEKLQGLTKVLAEAKKTEAVAVAASSTWEAERERLQQEIKLHANSAGLAHSEREQEVVSHANDVERMVQAKKKLVEVEQQLKAAESAVKTLTSTLESSQASWATQQHSLEAESSGLITKLVELREHNEVLLNQLESTVLQSKRLQQTSADEGDGESASEEGTTKDEPLEKLNKIIRYLRTEKEITSTELEQAQGEVHKLKQTNKHLSESAEELRAEVRKGVATKVDQDLSEDEHKKVIEQLNERNLLRESNTLLRDEHTRNLAHATELEHKLKEFEAAQAPLLVKMRGLEAEKTSLQTDVAVLKEESGRWKQRNEALINKYQTVDPEEFRTLQESFAKLQAEQGAAIALLEKEKTEGAATASKWRDLYNKQKAAAVKIKDKAERTVQQAEAKLTQLKGQIESSSHSQSEVNKGAANVTAAEARITELVDLLKEARRLIATRNIQLQATKQEVATLNAGGKSLQQASANTKAQLERERDTKIGEALAAKAIAHKTEMEQTQKEFEMREGLQKMRSSKVEVDLKQAQGSVVALNTEVQRLQEVVKQGMAETKKVRAGLLAQAQKAAAELKQATTELAQTKEQLAAAASSAQTPVKAAAKAATPKVSTPKAATPKAVVATSIAPASVTPKKPTTPKGAVATITPVPAAAVVLKKTTPQKAPIFAIATAATAVSTPASPSPKAAAIAKTPASTSPKAATATAVATPVAKVGNKRKASSPSPTAVQPIKKLASKVSPKASPVQVPASAPLVVNKPATKRARSPEEQSAPAVATIYEAATTAASAQDKEALAVKKVKLDFGPGSGSGSGAGSAFPTFGNTAASVMPVFGSGATAAKSPTSSLFGSSTTGFAAFSTPTAPTFGSPTPAFGSSTPTFGSTGSSGATEIVFGSSVFGSTSGTGFTATASTSAFGSSSSPTPLFGSESKIGAAFGAPPTGVTVLFGERDVAKAEAERKASEAAAAQEAATVAAQEAAAAGQRAEAETLRQAEEKEKASVKAQEEAARAKVEEEAKQKAADEAERKAEDQARLQAEAESKQKQKEEDEEKAAKEASRLEEQAKAIAVPIDASEAEEVEQEVEQEAEQEVTQEVEQELAQEVEQEVDQEEGKKDESPVAMEDTEEEEMATELQAEGETELMEGQGQEALVDDNAAADEEDEEARTVGGGEESENQEEEMHADEAGDEEHAGGDSEVVIEEGVEPLAAEGGEEEPIQREDAEDEARPSEGGEEEETQEEEPQQDLGIEETRPEQPEEAGAEEDDEMDVPATEEDGGDVAGPVDELLDQEEAEQQEEQQEETELEAPREEEPQEDLDVEEARPEQPEEAGDDEELVVDTPTDIKEPTEQDLEDEELVVDTPTDIKESGDDEE
jgi:nucleoprotein TPR